MDRTVHLVSLGCPKNRVDSEVILGHLVGDGFNLVDDPNEAAIIVVNTCGFIDAAKEESIDTILEMAEHKSDGRCQKLIVTGCLSQRYADELSREIPEVDHFLGTGNFETITELVGGSRLPGRRKLHRLESLGSTAATSGTTRPTADASSPRDHQSTSRTESVRCSVPDPDFTITAASPRVPSGPIHSTYVKVAEGCSNACSFCIIPAIRGPQRSRPIDDVVLEVEALAKRGAVEINLIAQDLCAYGKDLHPRHSLARLLRALNRVGERVEQPLWLRCLYAYPKGLTREVMEVIASAEHVLPYIDVPLQHISDRLLRSMRRGKGGAATRELVRRMREIIPGVTLRTAFITGLPGETNDDFEELVALVAEARFERLGVFTFSPEEGTPAATMPGQVDPDTAAERRERLLQVQKQISGEQQAALVGQTVEVLVDGVSPETELLLQGRHAGQAPDIDGVTYINDGTASPGEVVRVLIDQSHDYDLVGGIVDAD